MTVDECYDAVLRAATALDEEIGDSLSDALLFLIADYVPFGEFRSLQLHGMRINHALTQ